MAGSIWDSISQPMDQSMSASDMYSGLGGVAPSQYSSGGGMPMDAGPAFGFDSGYNALAGMGGGMGMGMQPQFDPQMQSLQHGMYAAGDQTPTAFTPDISPSGGGSWFKRLLSATVLGMAGGAGAPDPMTAFSAGYATVAQQRQQEAMMAQQMEKQRREQELQEIDRAKKNVDYLKAKFEYEHLPDKLHQDQLKAETDLVSAYDKMGLKPVHVSPNSEEGLAATQAYLKQTASDQNWIPAQTKDGIFIFRPPQEQATVPQGYTFNIGGNQYTTQGNEPWSFFSDMVQQIGQDQRTRYTQQQENARAAAGRENAWNIANLPSKSGNMPEWMQPGSFNDAQKSQLYSIDQKIAQLNREKAAAMQSPTADVSSYDSRVNQLYKQKQALSDQFVQENQSRVTRAQPNQMINTPRGPMAYGTPMTTKSGQTVYLIGIDSAGNPITTPVKP